MTVRSGVEPLVGDLQSGNDRWPASVTNLAAAWRLPVEWVDGACLAAGLPGIGHGERSQARVLARELTAWQRSYLTFTPCAPPPNGDLPASRLRELLRAMYCDDNGVRNILMLLAVQHLRLFGPDVDQLLALEILKVYIPLVSMMGMYRVRRAWIEQSARVLHWPEYSALAHEMDILLDKPTSEQIEELVTAQQRNCPTPDAAAKLPPVSKANLTLAERWHVFKRLGVDLEQAFRREFADAPHPRLELIPDLPGHAYYRPRLADMNTKAQLNVRVLCDTEEDCYRALGAIHAVCTSTSFGQFPAIRDYINSPRPNEFRLLQTLCLWPGSHSGASSRFVKFRIMTPEMHERNEMGILARSGPSDTTADRLHDWRRKRLDKPSENLYKRTKSAHADISAYLRDNPPGSTADSIYCFTPLGEIVLLKKGRTALDFAYRVHTQLLQLVARIHINGREVSFNTPLQNGDLVEITFNPWRVSIDFAWQDSVMSKRARAKIRVALLEQAERTHKGRRAFEDALIRQMNSYARRSNSYVPPACTSTDIDLFLERAALYTGATGLDDLYDALGKNAKLANDLSHRLVTETIITSLQFKDGDALRPDLEHIELCPYCKPTPNDPTIEGRLTREKTLVIHDAGCRHGSSKAPLLPITWAVEDPVEAWPLYRFEINTPDVELLLNKVLELIYSLPHAYLFGMDASVDQRHRAVIRLDVAVKLPQLCRDLQQQFLSLATNTQASYKSLMINRRGEVRAFDMSRQLSIPFVESAVSDWRFYGRDETMNTVYGWIYGHPALPQSHILLLHGQRRVGKSSVIQRLSVAGNLLDHTRRKVLPVLMTFQSVSLDRPDSVADLISNTVSRAVMNELPRRQAHEDAFVWLDRQLSEAKRLLGETRLLLIIDEFDAGYSRYVNTAERPQALQKLRAIIDTHTDIRWLLVVQSVYLADPILQAALPHLPVDVAQVGVRAFAHATARQFIIDLSTRHSISFALPAQGDDIPDQIAAMTAGNPYLIHVLCRRLLLRVGHDRRTLIQSADLDRTVRELLSSPGLYDHLFKQLRPNQTALLRRAAELIPIGGRLPLEVVQAQVARDANQPLAVVAAEFALFERIGLLEMRAEAGQRRDVAIPGRLLHEWIHHYWFINK